VTRFPFKELLQTVLYPTLFMLVCWIVFLLDTNFHLHLDRFGVSPRTGAGLAGILFAPLLHGDLNHILSNTLPMLVLGSLLFYFYKPIAWSSALWMYFISGVWLWMGGRNNDTGTMHHIGASTLIYAFASFLFFSGVFRKQRQLMVISALVAFLYGSITWAIFPFDQSISWEGHLFGALSGLLVAFNYRKEGPQEKQYWPDEEEDIDPALYSGEEPTEDIPLPPPSTNPFTITYHYLPKDEEKKDGA